MVLELNLESAFFTRVLMRRQGLWDCLVHPTPQQGIGFPGGSAIKNSPAKQETWIGSLGLEDPLEKEMATHSSILVWEIPWTEEPGGLQFMESQELDTTE